MTLIVEDGTALANAEAYITVAAADQYFSDRGNVAWAALLTPAKEQALRAATDYLSSVYALRWAGVRRTTTQALDWPRLFVQRKHVAGGYGMFPLYYDESSVPVEVQRACAELALRASTATLNPDVGAQVKSQQVGPIQVTYIDGARQSQAFKSIDAMLAVFCLGAGSVPVARA
jgi:hypothetical protein